MMQQQIVTLTRVDRIYPIGQVCRVGSTEYRVIDVYTMGAITVMLCKAVESGETHTLYYTRKGE